MKIAIVAAGDVGGTLSKTFAAKGHQIYFGVKDTMAEQHTRLLKEIGPNSGIHRVNEAVTKGDMIILATPWGVTEEVVKSFAEFAKNKIIVDCTNPLKVDLSGLEVGHTTSGGELVQSWAPEAYVFKSFNTTGFNIMADPVLENRKTVMFLCGDDQKHRRLVSELIQSVGFEVLDVGPLSSARLLEPMALLWIQLAYKFGMGRDFSFGILRRK
jgi:predicted dinucleotide-binding enzyme